MTFAPSRRALAALLLCALPLGAWAKGPKVENLKAAFEAGFVVASCALGDAFSREDLRAEIDSTRTVTLTYTLEVLKKRGLWKDKALGRRVVQRRITYDTLTRQYTVETLLDGEMLGSVAVSTYEEMAAVAGDLARVKVCPVADMEPNAVYEVRAQVKLLEDYALWVLPWDLETPWAECDLSTP